MRRRSSPPRGCAQGLPEDLIGSSKRWREWMELERPEDEPLPGDWKRFPEFDKLLLFRCAGRAGRGALAGGSPTAGLRALALRAPRLCHELP